MKLALNGHLPCTAIFVDNFGGPLKQVLLKTKYYVTVTKEEYSQILAQPDNA